MFVIFKSGGKQYVVSDGSFVDLELINWNLKPGDMVPMHDILCAKLSDGSAIYGRDVCAEKVSLELKVQNVFQDEKKIVFYKQRRQNHRRKKGHRQILMRVEVCLSERA